MKSKIQELKKSMKHTLSKTLILSSLGLFSFLPASAQSDPYAEVTTQIVKTYNSKNYKGFYALLSASFKSQQSEKEMTDFLKEINGLYGNMKTVAFQKEKDPFRHYKASFEKGDLELMLACNSKKEIEGLSFQPYAEIPDINKQIASDNPKQNALDLEVDSLVKAYLSKPENASLSIGILKNGKTVFYHYGETRKGTGNLPSNASIYEIGSISKSFTGILLAKAIEEQKVKADDDIRKYLPESCKNLSYKNTPVTLVQLANHTAGIPRLPENLTDQKNFDEKDPYHHYTKELLFAYLGKLKLKTMPGTVSEYSNTGMALLGVILEGVYGKSYEALVKEKITEPLHMAHTYQEVPAAELPKFCTGYDEKGHETPYWNLGDIPACGGLRSTISDMMLYLEANVEEKDPAIKLSHVTTFQNGKYNSLGMAWHKQQSLSGDELIWHNGGTYGFSSFMGLSKGKGYGVVVLSNSGNNVDALAISILKALKK
jgi:CubicO group peptidase (beta-lactamase class C family)